MTRKDQIVRIKGDLPTYRVVLVQHYWALLEPLETTLAAVLSDEPSPRSWAHVRELV